MILAFKPHFIEPIANNIKIHTIREDKPNRWKKNNLIHFATGVRTKNYNNFQIGICVSTQRFEIRYYSYLFRVTIDDRTLSYGEIETLAINDGFNNVQELLDFFDNKDFEGKIIHWTDFKY